MGQSGQAHAEGDRMVGTHADKDPAPPQEASSLSTHLPTHPFLVFHADTKVRSVSFFVVEKGKQHLNADHIDIDTALVI